MARLLEPNEIKYISKFILEHFNFMEFQSFLVQRSKIDFYNHMPMMSDFQTGVPLFIHKMSKNYEIPTILLALESKFPEEAKIKELILTTGASYHVYDESPEKPIVETSALQAMLHSEVWFETDKFFNLLGARKRCICRVEVTNAEGKMFPGTGFLISPNQVMTNYHVVQSVLDKPELLQKIVCRFDYEAKEGNTEFFAGTIAAVNEEKPIELFSKYCEHDANGEEDLTKECGADKLDFAIINLEEEIGNAPFGINSEDSIDTNTRGWIPLKVNESDKVADNNSLIILQHPEGHAMKMAIGLNKLMGVSPNKRRVRYNINTLPGSSGSPVFNTDFELVALHNMGDPRYIASFNQGIVMNRIIEYLKLKNFDISV